jgi:hypothetical protein
LSNARASAPRTSGARKMLSCSERLG